MLNARQTANSIGSKLVLYEYLRNVPPPPDEGRFRTSFIVIDNDPYIVAGGRRRD